ncbi:TTL domain-containing protein [Verticillium alfalfae VaMs.102]|uniref:TTL domain-containing protein n=1 Tax=Verticillium alfalfae (strain VaMs.102 / ATCC MYA-4576 / FGSC 10136) TaxID=526221 RepID=C9STC1_VERA1|nr:TTL domain-containing protein [Verticillium alfalfae VaMs.102]EEY22036.1 TTL domain-containing protein [Verticillium alfalfae VaMs.102]
MHILVTNDDGPPSPHSSPYVASLVAELKKAGHTVSVCLPHTQRSWIGKAHIIGQSVKPVYYTPSPNLYGDDAEGTIHTRPTTSDPATPGTFDADKEWVLVDGTPASCVQIGLHHFFAERGPVDLVVSGPNYGRNTTAVFALSSGTLGGAMEGAICGKKAIALSYAFFSRNHDPVIIGGAARHGVRVIEKLYADCPPTPASTSTASTCRSSRASRPTRRCGPACCRTTGTTPAASRSSTATPPTRLSRRRGYARGRAARSRAARGKRTSCCTSTDRGTSSGRRPLPASTRASRMRRLATMAGLSRRDTQASRP